MSNTTGTTILRGGTIVDGSRSPAVVGDVSFDEDGIRTVGGVVDEPGATEVDATGLVIAPGFIDLHTHFDAQMFWDAEFTPSCWHGVTTVVEGNCGFGIAPTRPADRENIMQTLENVEGMNLSTLRAGITWTFESFSEYLAAVHKLPKRLNVATFVGHTPLRIFVMGFEAATSREATSEEIGQMSDLLRDALRAGAIGFSTSQAPSHVGAHGRPVPSRVASREEIEQLLRVVASEPNPLVEITYGPQYDLTEVARMALELGVRVTWGSLMTRLFGPPGVAMGMLDEATKTGGDIWPQVSCREVVSQTTMANPYYFGQVPAFREIFAVPREDRAQLYADASWRDRARAEIPTYRPDAYRLASVAESELHPELIGIPIDRAACELGIHPFDLMLDVAIEEDLATRFRIVSLNDDEEELGSLLRDERVILGAHDAGAHADMLCDACFPTHLLSYWVREKGVLTLEEAVWRLTTQPADFLGLTDRGRLQPGQAADIAVFDPQSVGPVALQRVHDLPGGGDRLISRSNGMVGVWINGQRILDEQGDVKQAHPGVLIGQSPAR
jgi:N-acyl-D-aspartate/D-glutamate deacylase